jgi:hypothetical protein
MALKLKNNRYLKIDLKGNYIVYEDINARKLEQKHTSPEEINAKY